MSIKMAVNSKNKGNTFERKIANMLSDRFAEYTGLSASFRRNPDSGSFFGGRNQVRTETHNTEKASYGDIICPNNFNYNIECKHYKSSPSFSMLLEQSIKEWDGWLEQALQDAQHNKKKILIIIKYNRVDEFVIVQEPVENVYNLPYKDFFVVKLEHFLAMSDTKFFT